MTLPTRAIQAVRPEASLGVMGGAAVVAATFAATPFLLPDISSAMDIPLGTTGLLSTAQVASFAVASFLAGRLFRPRRRLHYGSLAVVAAATLMSALATNFPLLLSTRVAAGFGLGTLTWLAWAEATRFTRGLGDIAAVAPLTAAISSPAIGWLTELGGYQWVFGLLVAVTGAAAFLKVDFGDLPRIGRSVSRSHSNRFLLLALLLLSLGGSSVFVFTGAMAIGLQGLTPVSLSWALSINAITGVIATRSKAKRGSAWVWILGTAVSALVIGSFMSASLFFVALALWGFAFWMAVPEIMRLMTERSSHPSERMGDAQAAMAVGRIGGPLLGGAALALGEFGMLSLTGSMVMVMAAIIVGVVESYRMRHRNQPI